MKKLKHLIVSLLLVIMFFLVKPVYCQNGIVTPMFKIGRYILINSKSNTFFYLLKFFLRKTKFLKNPLLNILKYTVNTFISRKSVDLLTNIFSNKGENKDQINAVLRIENAIINATDRIIESNNN